MTHHPKILNLCIHGLGSIVGLPMMSMVLFMITKERLWFASQQGVGCLDDGKWQLYTGKEGLPFNDFTRAAAGKAGVVWFGTTMGAIRYRW